MTLDIGPWTLDFLQPYFPPRPMVPLDIDVRTVKQMFDRGEKFVLLDCRENSEVAAARIAGTLHIPMREIPARVAELPKEERVVVHCHHGGRSPRGTQFL